MTTAGRAGDTELRRAAQVAARWFSAEGSCSGSGQGDGSWTAFRLGVGHTDAALRRRPSLGELQHQCPQLAGSHHALSALVIEETGMSTKSHPGDGTHGRGTKGGGGLMGEVSHGPLGFVTDLVRGLWSLRRR
jgi:hypothetical protein